jgi:hypothetical protein
MEGNLEGSDWSLLWETYKESPWNQIQKTHVFDFLKLDDWTDSLFLHTLPLENFNLRDTLEPYSALAFHYHSNLMFFLLGRRQECRDFSRCFIAEFHHCKIKIYMTFNRNWARTFLLRSNFFFFAILGLELRAPHHPTSPFSVMGFFESCKLFAWVGFEPRSS